MMFAVFASEETSKWLFHKVNTRMLRDETQVLPPKLLDFLHLLAFNFFYDVITVCRASRRKGSVNHRPLTE